MSDRIETSVSERELRMCLGLNTTGSEPNINGNVEPITVFIIVVNRSLQMKMH